MKRSDILAARAQRLAGDVQCDAIAPPGEDPGEIAFQAERGAPSPVEPIVKYRCKICGDPCTSPGAVFCCDATEIRVYCSPDHCKEGGDWIR
jgi:hypothetical protein